jgi:hypothetical protein
MTIAIWGAETSLGDPALGGELVKVWNIGCLRAFPAWQWTKWGALATGTVTIRGVSWLAFPGPWAGAMGWGRYMKVGAHGAYRLHFDTADWTYPVARVYYGESVAGFRTYLANLQAIDRKYDALALAHGFVWQ